MLSGNMIILRGAMPAQILYGLSPALSKLDLFNTYYLWWIGFLSLSPSFIKYPVNTMPIRCDSPTELFNPIFDSVQFLFKAFQQWISATADGVLEQATSGSWRGQWVVPGAAAAQAHRHYKGMVAEEAFWGILHLRSSSSCSQPCVENGEKAS